MTDNEIIKALECCASGCSSEACRDCPFDKKSVCIEKENALAIHALDLIIRQKAEIDRLEIELKAMRGAAGSYKAEVERSHEENTQLLKEIYAKGLL